MQIQFTAVFRKVPEGYVGFVEELPGANTQGATLDEARVNLQEAVELVLEANRALAELELGTADVIREPLRLTAWSALISCATCWRTAVNSSVKVATTRYS